MVISFSLVPFPPIAPQTREASTLPPLISYERLASFSFATNNGRCEIYLHRSLVKLYQPAVSFMNLALRNSA